MQWAVKQARKDAGFEKDVCVHMLRHTFATHLLEDGLDINSLKNLLGQEQIETLNKKGYFRLKKEGS